MFGNGWKGLHLLCKLPPVVGNVFFHKRALSKTTKWFPHRTRQFHATYISHHIMKIHYLPYSTCFYLQLGPKKTVIKSWTDRGKSTDGSLALLWRSFSRSCTVRNFVGDLSEANRDTVDGRHPAPPIWEGWKPYLVGGWATPVKNMSQLGWLATQY